MKLYKEVLIEYTEQAEALPEGAIVVEVDAKTGTHNWAFTLAAWDTDDLNVFPTEYHIALVPIEAEEEYSTPESRRRWGEDGIYPDTEAVRLDKWRDSTESRYVTAWTKEEA